MNYDEHEHVGTTNMHCAAHAYAHATRIRVHIHVTLSSSVPARHTDAHGHGHAHVWDCARFRKKLRRIPDHWQHANEDGHEHTPSHQSRALALRVVREAVQLLPLREAPTLVLLRHIVWGAGSQQHCDCDMPGQRRGA